MADIYLIKYSVKGIKAIDQLVSLSFYKKIIPKNADTQAYNIKGIYGMNGSGKSGIVTSVKILKNILTAPGYLNNPIIQKNLDSIINKKMNSDKKITKYQNEIIKATGVYTKYPKEVIIGGILIIKNNREIYFLDEAYNKDLEKFYSSHLIKWEIIKKYLNEGYKIFNLGSIKSIDKKDGNYTFKMGFGAKVYEYIGTYDLIINRYLYYFAKFIVKINEMIKRITKK